jgi:methylenetetrahydrofolate--tRNA-(uracil-5-)-methyltransferase
MMIPIYDIQSTPKHILIVGGGLAGCEVALQLARFGIPVQLTEMKPLKRTPAQHTDRLAELVCSNSFRSDDIGNAIGLLKREMRNLGSAIMEAADATKVPAGSALAVDRDLFGDYLTRLIEEHPLIELKHEVVERLPNSDEAKAVVICTGPLTDTALADDIASLTGRESLYFYDAIAPIIDSESINWDIVWRQSRYDKGEADYANIPLSKEEYYTFVDQVINGEKVTPKAFEEAKYFEGCLPIEVMAERGVETLAFGPLKPVGLTDPRTGQRPYAVAQLRMENQAATAWNMVGFQTRLKYPEQKRIFKSLPGLEQAEFLRFGSIHRNTYLHAPSVLDDQLRSVHRDGLYFAGQITGVEGYVESSACGQMIAWHILSHLRGETFTPPPTTTAFGAMRRHLRQDGVLSKYAPSNLNWSFFDPIEKLPKRKDERGRRIKESKREKRLRMAERAQLALKDWAQDTRLTWHHYE